MNRIPRATTRVVISTASEIVTRPIRVARLIAVLLAIVDVAPSRAGNRVWLPPVQVSHVDTSSTAGPVALSRSGSDRIHVVIGTQAPVDETVSPENPNPDGDCHKFSNLFDYLSVEWDDADWSAAWEGRLRYTWDNSESGGWFSTDPHMAVDILDGLHFVNEEHQLGGEIGYKLAGPTGWAMPPPDFSLNAPESPVGAFAGVSPSLYIEERSPGGLEDDVVHVIWRHVSPGPPATAAYWHNKKSLASSGSWGTPTLLTSAWEDCTGPPGEGGVAPAFTITSDGALHLVGRCRLPDEDPAIATILHVRAVWTGTSWSSTTIEIDDMPLGGAPEEAEGDVSTDISLTASSSLLGGEYLHASYNYSGLGETEIRYSRYTVNGLLGEWSTPIVVTGDDDSASEQGRLFQDHSGTLHLIYHDGGVRDLLKYYDPDTAIEPCDEGTIDPSEAPDLLRNELRYVHATGNPETLANWSAPQSLTADMRTAFLRPNFVAQDDTLWTLFMSHDDDDEARGGSWTDGNWEIWSRKSYPIDAVVADGDSMVWSGLICLDRDFVVQEGGLLTVEAGTVVVAAPDDQDDHGLDEDRVELVVHGTLQVDGDEPGDVTFRSLDGEEGDWGGILFDVTAAEAGYGFATNSSITGAEIKDATYGLRIRQTGAPSLDGVMFSNIQNDYHVVLDSRATIRGCVKG